MFHINVCNKYSMHINIYVYFFTNLKILSFLFFSILKVKIFLMIQKKKIFAIRNQNNILPGQTKKELTYYNSQSITYTAHFFFFQMQFILWKRFSKGKVSFSLANTDLIKKVKLYKQFKRFHLRNFFWTGCFFILRIKLSYRKENLDILRKISLYVSFLHYLCIL